MSSASSHAGESRLLPRISSTRGFSIHNSLVLIPSQGFRHAATLLLAKHVRSIPADASQEDIHHACARLADELVALADDTRAPAEACDWLTAEFNTTLDRIPYAFDRERARRAGAAILARVSSRTADIESRDLFLIYVPEDRLPIAAPLAVELTKRRVSVAFADYEVATAAQFADAVARGLDRHRGGVVLHTHAFERARCQIESPENSRVQIVRHPENPSTVADLAGWAHDLRARNVAK